MKCTQFIFCVLVLLFSSGLHSQLGTDTSAYRFVPQTAERTDVFAQPDVDAEYPGGFSKLLRFIGQNLKYPETCTEMGIQGKLFIRFTVEKDGAVSLIQIRLKKGFDCLEEVEIQLAEWLEKMPKWNPAYLNGEPVASIFNFPIGCIKPY